MKYIVPLFFLLLPLQLISAQNFEFFALAGPVVSQIDGDHFGGYDKMGIMAGAGVAHKLNTNWCAQMELAYIQKGKGIYNAQDGSTYKVKLNYIHIPVLAKYSILEQLSIESGLSLGFLMAYQFLEDGEPNNSHQPYTPNNVDLNWLLGGTYVFSDEWKLNLRFAYSILPMGSTIEDNIYRPNFWRKTGGQYNNSLALAVQYWF